MSMKLSLIKSVLASVLRRSLLTGLNNLYWGVSQIMAAILYSTDSIRLTKVSVLECSGGNFLL